MTNESTPQMKEKQTEFELAPEMDILETMEPDELLTDEIAADALSAEHENAGEILDFGPEPAIDETLQAPIEADAALLKDIGAIPQKMAFKIGEAAEMVGVKQYVLRYWESEFDMLRPRKSSNGQRVYSRKDVETAMMIKKLLYKDRFSIEGARSALRALKSTVKTTVAVEKTTEKLVKSQETVVGMVQSLLEEIRRARESFS